MWPEKLPNGKVKFVERYTDPLTGKEKKKSVTFDKDTRATRKAAQAILAQKIEDALKKLTLESASNSNVTLGDLVEAYRLEQEKTVKPSTYRRNYFMANSMMDVLGRDTLLHKLNAPYIREKMYAQDKKNSSINELLKRSKGILRWGYNNDYLDDISFLDKIKPLPDSSYREKIEDKFLETDELLLLRDGMAVERWRLLTEFLAFSGIRIGEAIALNKSDLDFQERIIHIHNTYDSNNLLDTTAKSSASHREVYMQDDLYNVCKKINSYMLKQSLINGYGKSPIFFQEKDGGRVHYSSYNSYIKENGLRILGREKVTPHILRHTHTCMLAENDVPLETITRRLGHEDSEITRMIYLHVTKKMRQNDHLQVAKVKIL